jgi:hypothetical protein
MMPSRLENPNLPTDPSRGWTIPRRAAARPFDSAAPADLSTLVWFSGRPGNSVLLGVCGGHEKPGKEALKETSGLSSAFQG